MSGTIDPIDNTIAQAKEILVLHELSNGNDVKSINTMADALLGFMLLNHVGPAPDKDQITKIFAKREGIDWLSKDYLTSIEAGFIPLIVLKCIMGTHKVPVEVPTLTHWEPFLERFADSLPKLS